MKKETPLAICGGRSDIFAGLAFLPHAGEKMNGGQGQGAPRQTGALLREDCRGMPASGAPFIFLQRIGWLSPT